MAKVEVATGTKVKVHLVPDLRTVGPHEARAGVGSEDGGVTPVEAIPHGDVTREARRLKGTASTGTVPLGHRRLRAATHLVPST